MTAARGHEGGARELILDLRNRLDGVCMAGSPMFWRELADAIASALQAAVQDVERKLADAERERDGAVNLYNLMLDAKTEVRREYEAAMRLVDCRAVPPCGQCRACEKARAQALAAALTDLLREVEGGFIAEGDYHRIKRVLAAARAAIPPPQAAP